MQSRGTRLITILTTHLLQKKLTNIPMSFILRSKTSENWRKTQILDTHRETDVFKFYHTQCEQININLLTKVIVDFRKPKQNVRNKKWFAKLFEVMLICWTNDRNDIEN